MQPLKKELSQDIDWSMVDKEDNLLTMERSLKKGRGVKIPAESGSYGQKL